MENSVPAYEKIITKHHPEGIDPEQIFFDETRVRDLILEYQREPNPETWQLIVLGCLPLIESYSSIIFCWKAFPNLGNWFWKQSAGNLT
jgi:hypothetical protein